MNIQDKLWMNIDQLIEHGPITIVAFGDSVTHASFETDKMDYDAVYWNRLRNKIMGIHKFIPVNMICAGIGGATAHSSLGRLQKQVLDHHPDAVIVCFGLNDINRPLEEFQAALREIFTRCQEAGAEPILLTPNMLNTRVAEDVDDCYKEYAAVTADFQNSGKMDAYMDGAKAVAKEQNVRICDCYAEWKKRSETEDVTMLLANRINHPSREMHELFAERLFQLLFGEVIAARATNNSTMYIDQQP